MNSNRIFHITDHVQIGVVTLDRELFLLSPRSGEITRHAGFAIGRDIDYVMEIGQYWGVFLHPRGVVIVNPHTLTIQEKFPVYSPNLPRTNVGITPEACFAWREEDGAPVDTILEIALEDLRVKRNMDLSQWCDEEDVDFAISRNAKVAALASLDFIMAWDLRTNETLYRDDEAGGYLSINPQGTHLAVGDADRIGMGIIDLETGTSYGTIAEQGSPDFAEWSPQGDLLAINQENCYAPGVWNSGEDCHICGIWNTRGEQVAYHAFPESIEGVAWISDEELALVSRLWSSTQGLGFQVYLWNGRRGEIPRLLYPVSSVIPF
jgi:hypothetical protein